MRISGGIARGIPLKVPPGDAVRPATDGMRQALFSSLGARVGGATFLDLFAGSGAYGLEALSRGAATGVFVERSPKAAGCLRRNLEAVAHCLGRDAGDLARVSVCDALSAAAVTSRAPDLVFIDPPYAEIDRLAPDLFAMLDRVLEGVDDPLVMFEMPGECDLAPAGWVCAKRIGRGVRQPSVALFRRGKQA